jgi:hypothetical protein
MGDPIWLRGICATQSAAVCRAIEIIRQPKNGCRMLQANEYEEYEKEKDNVGNEGDKIIKPNVIGDTCPAGLHRCRLEPGMHKLTSATMCSPARCLMQNRVCTGSQIVSMRV